MLHSVNGVRLNVIDEGGGPPLLLVHGLGGTWRDWEPQLDSLTDHFRVIVPEHRGHGRSDRGDEKLSVPLIAGDLQALCGSLGVERAAVVGLSLGGMVAHLLAVDGGDLVAALGIADSTPSVPEPARSEMLAAAPFVRDRGMAVVGQYLMESRGAPEADQRALARAWRSLGSNDPLVYADAIEALCGYDGWARLGAIRQPTLVVRGSLDPLVTAPDERSVADAIPDARYREVEGAGHTCNIDRPDLFDQILVEFLEDVGYGGSAST